MTLLYFLTLFPLVPALGMLLARGDRARDAVGLVGSGIIMGGDSCSRRHVFWHGSSEL